MARGDHKTTKTGLAEYLATRPPGALDEAEFREICDKFNRSPDYLRKLIRDSGVPLTPLVEGVRQDSLEELERTLLALEGVYAQAAGRDVSRQHACRKAVIKAKDHARWSLRRASNTEEHIRVKQEMIGWMLVWLENPEVFRDWLRLRQKELSAQPEAG